MVQRASYYFKQNRYSQLDVALILAIVNSSIFDLIPKDNSKSLPVCQKPALTNVSVRLTAFSRITTALSLGLFMRKSV